MSNIPNDAHALLRSNRLYSATFRTWFVDISVLFCVSYGNSYGRRTFCCNEGSEDGNVLWVEMTTDIILLLL